MDLKPVVLCGPSGVGKSTFIKKLLQDYKDVFDLSISHTSRKPRKGEIDGREYHFVSREEINKGILDGEFIEHAEFSNNIYGTSKKAIRDIQKTGKICILDIDVQGVKQLKNLGDKHFAPIYIFIMPPDMKTLEERLRARKTDSEEAIIKRLNTAEQEIKYAKEPGNFDAVIKNDDFDKAYSQFLDCLKETINEAGRLKLKV
ncbi:unnamed protein product [Gordionus sp. m RMFG-2023]|uniref:guanylate kinase-like n=1 Tax=Gordionus sp. m RMFG-2023 TaxID=3053472 RepID=UPI0030E04A6B